MKTAMQELLDVLDINETNFISRVDDKVATAYHDVIRKTIVSFIETEKEKIIHTYWEAYKEGRFSSNRTAEEYYQQTFNPEDDGYSDFNL
jgi:hypothetical protein